MSIIYIVSSCSSEKNNFSIKGKINGNHPDKIYLYFQDNKNTRVIDSAFIDKKNKFILKGYTEWPGFYLLKFKNTEGITIIIYPGDKINTILNGSNYEIDYLVEGSYDSRRWWKILKEQIKTKEKIHNLSEHIPPRNHPDYIEKINYADSIYEIIFNEYKNTTIDFILEDPCTFSSLKALYQRLGKNEWVFDLKKDFKYYSLVDSCLSIIAPGSNAIKYLNNTVVAIREMMKTEIGALAPEINLPDTTGEKVSLSSLRGDYVLIDFSALWCDECMHFDSLANNFFLKHKLKNFKIYRVSLDRTFQSWKEGIMRDTLGWIHVCDLQYWNSEAVITYGVKKIPANFLIDPEGLILEKNISPDSLNTKIQDYLN